MSIGKYYEVASKVFLYRKFSVYCYRITGVNVFKGIQKLGFSFHNFSHKSKGNHKVEEIKGKKCSTCASFKLRKLLLRVSNKVQA